jgi:DNA-binding PadR family transcriptional regulator
MPSPNVLEELLEDGLLELREGPDGPEYALTEKGREAARKMMAHNQLARAYFRSLAERMGRGVEVDRALELRDGELHDSF